MRFEVVQMNLNCNVNFIYISLKCFHCHACFKATQDTKPISLMYMHTRNISFKRENIRIGNPGENKLAVDSVL